MALPPPFPVLRLVGLLVGGTTVLLLTLVYASSHRRRPRTTRLSDVAAGWKTAGVGCPVLFTDRTGFEGRRRCFQLGAERELPPPSAQPVMSVAVRPGYRVVGYGEPDFRGEHTLSLRGPADRTYVDLYSEPVSGRTTAEEREARRRSTAPPVVRSLRVRLDTGVTSAAARRKRAERPSGGPG